MTDTSTPPAGTAPATTGGQPPADPAETTTEESWASRAGTGLMIVAVAAVAIITLDVMFKGRILGPLFQVLRPPAAAEAGPEDAPPPEE